MAWITKLTEADYSVHRNGLAVVFRDNRNQKAFPLDFDTTNSIRRKIGLWQPDNVWISIAINNGLIPHPYDEYV